MLREGRVVSLDGVLVKIDNGPIQPGDLYVAERNTGPKLLTALRINHELNCVVPTTQDYSFDTCECVKVQEA